MPRKPANLPATERTRVLDAMGRCRDVLIKAGMTVSPFGPAYVAMLEVTKAIDGLATKVTGREGFYALRPHGGGADDGWKDQGT